MDITSPVNHHCLLNALHVYTDFFLGQPPDLHLSQPLTSVDDLRVQDYAQRTLLRTACAAQLVRAVHAVRHAASHYQVWAETSDPDKVLDFTRAVFPGTDSRLVLQMVSDGQWILWLEQSCRNAYIGYLMAADWARFQQMSLAQLHRVATIFLSIPFARRLLERLSVTWPSESYSFYAGRSCHFRVDIADTRDHQSKSSNTSVLGRTREFTLCGLVYVLAGAV